MCGLEIEHDGERVLAIRGDREDPFSRGHLCPKALALKDVHEDPDRLRRPLVRRGDRWQELDWPEALDEVGARLSAIRRAHGKDAVAFYQGNPTVHNYGSLIYGGIIFPLALGTRARFSATSVDHLPRLVVSLALYGHQVILPVPDLDRTAHLLVLGANPAVSNGSLMTAPDVVHRLEAIRARGGRVVVVDPRRSETAALASEHLFIRPGSDALLLLAMVNVLFAEARVRPGRLERFVDHIGEVRQIAAPYTPERVAAATGIAAADIRRLAREFAAAPSAVAYGRVGVSTQEFGALATWLIDVLNILTGNLDRAGGAMFTTPAVDLVTLADWAGQRGHAGRYQSRVRGLPEFGGELPTAVLAEEIETPGRGQIRALITSSGNPVLSAPNGPRLARALDGLELMVAVDIYLNETTRHAHYILPPTFALEHEHYDLALHLLAIRNTARWSPPLFAPPPGALHDWEIFLELGTRLDGDGAMARWLGRAKRALGRRVTPEAMVDFGLRIGPWGDKYNPLSRRLNLERLKAAPHGIDLGPLEPRLPGLLRTPGRRIALAPAELTRDLPRLAARRDGDGGGTLSLIGRRDLRSNNSWMHNSLRLVKGKPRCTLVMHPDDAGARGLVDGQTVTVRSRVGAVEAPLEVSDEVMRGVVSLPHGWGHARAGVKLAVAERHAGVSCNDITDEDLVDELCGNAALNGVPVTVSAAATQA
jgi:anaerobic selenocysteine-containing dehydrogenase